MFFIRYESATVNAHGRRSGIFGLANGLARSGRLSEADWDWWRANNDWFESAYVDPGTVDPTIFDRAVNPYTSCWFKSSASHLLGRIPGYLALLDRHAVPWVERRSSDPGRVLYEDDDQIVVVPYDARRAADVRSATTTGGPRWRR